LLGHRRCQRSPGDGRHEFGAEDSSRGVLRREVHRVTSPDGPCSEEGASTVGSQVALAAGHASSK
jgi:hypothetical protein